jgi:hypothetical protein
VRFSLLVRVAVFLAAFTLEVRVKADTLQLPLASERREEPNGCWEKSPSSSSSCAIRTLAGEKLELNLGGSQITLAEATVVVRVSPNEVRLVAGTVWVKAKEAVIVSSEFGSFSAASGEMWVWRETERAYVASVSSTVELRARGAKEVLEVAPGLENWLGRVGPNGQAQTGLPMAIELKSHLLRWAKLYSGPKANFEKEAAAFHDTWVAAADEAAAIHKELFSRQLASMRSAAAVHARDQQKVEVYNHELRERLRRHALEE